MLPRKYTDMQKQKGYEMKNNQNKTFKTESIINKCNDTKKVNGGVHIQQMSKATLFRVCGQKNTGIKGKPQHRRMLKNCLC